MQAQTIGFQLDWHTIEKAAWIVGGAFVTALLTIARPWLGKQIIRLLQEDKASYKEFGREIWSQSFKKLDDAADNASEALRMAREIRETVERLESASNEQGEALAELKPAIARTTVALEAILKDFGSTQIAIARLEERQRLRQSQATGEFK